MSHAVAGGNCARACVTTRSMAALRVPEVTKTGRFATTSTAQVIHIALSNNCTSIVLQYNTSNKIGQLKYVILFLCYYKLYCFYNVV